MSAVVSWTARGDWSMKVFGWDRKQILDPMMRRIAKSLVLVVVFVLLSFVIQAQTFSPLPTPTTLSAMQAAMQANAALSSEYAGNPITLDVGDIIPGNVRWKSTTTTVSNASYTDRFGNVFTLPFQNGGQNGCQSNCPFGQVFMNGHLLNSGADYMDALIVVGGVPYFEDGKGHGWFSWTPSGGFHSLPPFRDAPWRH
jgi:hypothetical protein